MTRVKKLSIKDISEENKDEYLKFKNLFSSFENQLSVYSHSPVGMKHLYGMSSEISQSSALPKRVSKTNVNIVWCTTHQYWLTWGWIVI